jgi:hypothetical protein
VDANQLLGRDLRGGGQRSGQREEKRRQDAQGSVHVRLQVPWVYNGLVKRYT